MDVYLAPHFDDAVLSCGGRLWRGQVEGRAQRVITVCAGVPDYRALPPYAAELHARWGNPPHLVELRRAEDRAALARLGVLDVVHLGLLDCIYRLAPDHTPLYDSDAALFGPFNPNETLLIASLVDAIGAYLPDTGACTLYAPLCAGAHVDHQLVYAAAQRLSAHGQQVVYYEDQPYAALTGLQVAPHHPAGDRRLLDLALAGKDWQAETLALDAADLAAKVASMAYYRSQLSVLFGDEARMGRALHLYAAAVAPEGAAYGERVWRPGVSR
jgi:LmbE family N-acetylglucosaminyl deacetylase